LRRRFAHELDWLISAPRRRSRPAARAETQAIASVEALFTASQAVSVLARRRAFGGACGLAAIQA
jgi:hypothetical protein